MFNIFKKTYESELEKLKSKFHPESQDFKLYKLDLDFKYRKVSEYEYNDLKLDILYDGKNGKKKELEEKKLENKKKYDKISENDYKKLKATLNDEPYVNVTNWKIENGEISYEIDYNKQLIRFLQENGYHEDSDDETVNVWLHDLFIDNASQDPELTKYFKEKFALDNEETKTDEEKEKNENGETVYR